MKLDLNYVGTLERHHLVQTDAPLATIWRSWLKFGDAQYLTKISSNLDVTAKIAVSTFVRQAFEYYEASQSATILTRPLLSYYSLHNLAKAFLLLKTDTRPPGYHGLAKAQPADSLLDLSAETNKGLFLELCGSMGATIAIGRRFTLGEFVKNVVELGDDLYDYYGDRHFYLPANVNAMMSGKLEIAIPCRVGTPSELSELLRSRTRLLDEFGITTSKDDAVTLEPTVPLPEYPHLESAGSELMARHFATSPLTVGAHFIKLAPRDSDVPAAAAYLGYMFLLSSLVRYFPEALEKLISARSTSNEWFVEQLCQAAERVFPNLLLDSLYEVTMKFRNSSW